uniref:Uncharacterized protein n=1 Tax=Arundo donax TaxID=35708 RepID=A0A0A9BB08_ARUDO
MPFSCSELVVAVVSQGLAFTMPFNPCHSIVLLMRTHV